MGGGGVRRFEAQSVPIARTLLELPIAVASSSSSPAGEVLSGPCGGATGGGATTTGGGGDDAEVVSRAAPLSEAPSAAPWRAPSSSFSAAPSAAAAPSPLFVRCNASGALLSVTCPAGAVSWTATCPAANATRACLYYDRSRAAWSDRGVGVASRDASAALLAAASSETEEAAAAAATTRVVRCETTHLSDFAEAGRNDVVYELISSL